MPTPLPASTARELLAQLDQCLARDRYGLRGRLRRLSRRGAAPVPAALATRVAESARARARRLDQLPQPDYPGELPISRRRDEIVGLIRQHQVLVLCGETGSGKSTQLPKLCLEAGRGTDGMIGHTQPRRIAARAIASRISAELGDETGSLVGHKVRFSDTVARDAYIKLMTDGILLAEIHSDPFLTSYDTLIIDEAHERNLNVDFLLGYLKRLLPRRPDLRLIITSATIDPHRFAQFFGDAPVLEVSGRSYPVDIRYRPRNTGDGDEQDLQQAIRAATDELVAAGPGDILVFLSGEREIRETAESLRRHYRNATEILPLYARLSAQEQDRVFRSHGGRRIVLATNVAETSLTVPGIRYVVDPGYARIKRCGSSGRVQRLPVEPVSRSSANQRAGRCGRVADGICIRLYTEQDYADRPAFTDPEIRRSALAGVILRMEAMRLGHVEEFPFIDPPDTRAINDGYRQLRELQAVDDQRRLTDIGRRLARLPVDPAIGRMLLAAGSGNCLREVLVIAAALSIQDPRERPLDRRQQADAAHRQFDVERSDLLGLLRLWDSYHEQRRRLSGNRLRAWCRSNFLSWLRMREWQDMHRQLHQLMKDTGERVNRAPADAAVVHQSLLTGLIGNVACRQPDGEFRGAHGRSLYIFPGSSLRKARPAWIMAAELIQTSRLFASGVAAVEPEWIEQAAPHLVKRAWLEPHWERKPARVMAWEQVSLYGLVIIPRRSVHFGPLDPVLAREIFLRSALVAGDYDSDAPFFTHNQGLRREVEELEHKSRRRDVLVDDESLFHFYDQRVPEGIVNGAGFEAWRRKAERDDPRKLFLTREHLMQHEATAVTGEQYPDHLDTGFARLPLSYHFEPGDPHDGVTVTVPLAALNQLELPQLDRLVPALLCERVIALIRSLPKSLRRHFVPVPEYAEACLPALVSDPRELTRVLSERLKAMTGVPVPDHAWDESRLPAHLRMNIAVVDSDGRVINEGRDLVRLKAQLGENAASDFRAGGVAALEREAIRDWDFGDLPETTDLPGRGNRLQGFPALVDEDDSVAIRIFDTRSAADVAMHNGVRRLIRIRLAQQVKYLARNLPDLKKMCLHWAPLGSCEELTSELIDAAVDRVFLANRNLPRSEAGFRSLVEQGAGSLTATAGELASLVAKVLERYHRVVLALEAVPVPALAADIRDQLGHLVYPGFVIATGDRWLQRLPAYLDGILLRLERYPLDPARDAARATQFQEHWQRWRDRVQQSPETVEDPELEKYRWMLEEYRLSLFAQQVRSAFPISAKRLDKQWALVGAR